MASSGAKNSALDARLGRERSVRVGSSLRSTQRVFNKNQGQPHEQHRAGPWRNEPDYGQQQAADRDPDENNSRQVPSSTNRPTSSRTAAITFRMVSPSLQRCRNNLPTPAQQCTETSDN